MKAMILAAGRGERMRPLTDQCPKPLLDIGGRPLIVWHLQRLRSAGFTEVVINHAWLGGMIESALGSGERFGLHISYSPEAGALETAGGIAQALSLLGGDHPFLVINGDIWCDFDFSRAQGIVAQMAASRPAALAWLVLVPNPAQHPEGDFVLHHGSVTDGPGARLTFSGIGVYHPSLFACVPRGSKARLAPILRDAMQTFQVAGECHDGDWQDIGTPERLASLDARLRRTTIPA